jgi:lactate permease
MQYFLAFLPILIVLALMLFLHWGGQRAGPAGWLAGIVVALLAFGLTPDVLWVSQAKGVLLALYVLAVLWPAILLYNVVNQAGGIRAIALALEQTITDRPLLLIVLAWAFSGVLEGLAGFGLPIAVVAPMLTTLGVEPVMAVAAVAVGHSWSVTFGDMGVIFQTLIGVTHYDGAYLAPAAAVMLGVACVLCGLAAARILHTGRRWLFILFLSILMALTQYALAISGLTPLAALGAGIVGVGGGVILSKLLSRGAEEPGSEGAGEKGSEGAKTPALPCSDAPTLPITPAPRLTPSLKAALLSYGGLTVLMSVLALVQPLRATLNPFVWQMNFPQVSTAGGLVTPAGAGQAFRFFLHPGTSILLVALVSYWLYYRKGYCMPGAWRNVLKSTWRAAAPSSVGIISMMGLAALMDHCGMTMLLAEGLSAAVGAAFPLVSPMIGVLGAFATGSNNNSNVLFGSLQKSAALLLAIDPRILLAAQTAGGSLGSMIAPAKLIVGCSTVGLDGHDGEVLRRTLLYGLGVGLVMGIVALVWSILVR